MSIRCKEVGMDESAYDEISNITLSAMNSIIRLSTTHLVERGVGHCFIDLFIAFLNSFVSLIVVCIFIVYNKGY